MQRGACRAGARRCAPQGTGEGQHHQQDQQQPQRQQQPVAKLVMAAAPDLAGLQEHQRGEGLLLVGLLGEAMQPQRYGEAGKSEQEQWSQPHAPYLLCAPRNMK